MGIHSRARPTIASLLVSSGNGYENIKIQKNKNIKVLESGARDNHVLCGSKGYQSDAIVASVLVQTVFSDCWAKNTFSPHFRVKIAN